MYISHQCCDERFAKMNIFWQKSVDNFIFDDAVVKCLLYQRTIQQIKVFRILGVCESISTIERISQKLETESFGYISDSKICLIDSSIFMIHRKILALNFPHLHKSFLCFMGT